MDSGDSIQVLPLLLSAYSMCRRGEQWESPFLVKLRVDHSLTMQPSLSSFAPLNYCFSIVSIPSQQGSIAAAILFAGMATAMSTAFSTPCLTLPFCIVATVCHLLLSDGDIRGCIGAKTPICPEANYAKWMKEVREKEKADGADHLQSEMEHASKAQSKRKNQDKDNARVFYGPSTVQPARS